MLKAGILMLDDRIHHIDKAQIYEAEEEIPVPESNVISYHAWFHDHAWKSVAVWL